MTFIYSEIFVSLGPPRLDEPPLRPLAPLKISNLPIPLDPRALKNALICAYSCVYLVAFPFSPKCSPYSSYLSSLSSSLLIDDSTLKSFLLSFLRFSRLDVLPLYLSDYRADLLFLDWFLLSSCLDSSLSSKLMLFKNRLYSTGYISPKSFFLLRELDLPIDL